MNHEFRRIAFCFLVVIASSVGCSGQAAPGMATATGGSHSASSSGGTGGLSSNAGGTSAVSVIDGGPGRRLDDYLGNPAYPDDFWQPAAPVESLVNTALLEQSLDWIQSHGWEVHSFLVARDGRLVFERYGWSSGSNPGEVNTTPHQVVPSERQPSFSVTKSITGALVGSANANGLISGVASTIATWFPNLSDPAKSAITLDELMTMRSGLTFTEGESAVFQEPNPAESLLSRALATTPGTAWNYSSGDAHIVSEILHRATGVSPLDYAKANLFGPLGIIDPPWDADATGTNIGGFGLSLTAREMARFGELYRNSGKWGNQQVIPADWISTSTTFKCATLWGMNYGYYWFLPNLYDFFVAIGFNGQQIFVSRTYRLVVVFTGHLSNDEANTDYTQLITNYVVPAMK